MVQRIGGKSHFSARFGEHLPAHLDSLRLFRSQGAFLWPALPRA
jgi:hypothetical protein